MRFSSILLPLFLFALPTRAAPDRKVVKWKIDMFRAANGDRNAECEPVGLQDITLDTTQSRTQKMDTCSALLRELRERSGCPISLLDQRWPRLLISLWPLLREWTTPNPGRPVSMLDGVQLGHRPQYRLRGAAYRCWLQLHFHRIRLCYLGGSSRCRHRRLLLGFLKNTQSWRKRSCT